jgi:hypothetical protein
MKIVNLPSAREDIANGFKFYEEQEAGVGNYFLECLFSDIDSLHLYAGIHRKNLGFHRFLSKRFPYAIYYSMEEETVFVWAILDCRQNPEKIRKKLKSLH